MDVLIVVNVLTVLAIVIQDLQGRIAPKLLALKIVTTTMVPAPKGTVRASHSTVATPAVSFVAQKIAPIMVIATMMENVNVTTTGWEMVAML
jgi:hypothetical protein